MRDCFGDISPIRISVNGVLYSPVMLARPPPQSAQLAEAVEGRGGGTGHHDSRVWNEGKLARQNITWKLIRSIYDKFRGLIR